MRALTSIAFILFTASVLAAGAKAAEAEGCSDLKLFPRLPGCLIVECSAKQHESFDTSADVSILNNGPLDANVNTLHYSCPVSVDLERVKRELDSEIRKAGYQAIAQDKTDPSSPAGTARKGTHWLRWEASAEDGTTSYSLISAEGAAELFKAEACGHPAGFTTLKQCDVVECTSKSEDSVAVRTAKKEETSLTGSVQTITLACPSMGAAQAFSALESELKAAGSEILFSDRERPESGWMTGRAGKRWVELVSAPDGESVSYALTVVPSAEVLTAAKSTPSEVKALVTTVDPAPSPKPVGEPKPVEVAKPVETAVVLQAVTEQGPPAAVVGSAPGSRPAGMSVAAVYPQFVPPKPILEVPIEPTHDRIYSVVGDVVINMLVDVSEEGVVTNVVLTGRVTKDVLRLESPAREAVMRWRFEPAQQDGRIVPAVRIPVQMHFRGRPWRF